MLSPTIMFTLLILYTILMYLLFKHDPMNVTKKYQSISIILTLLGGTLIILLGFLSYQENPLFNWSDFYISDQNRAAAALGAPSPLKENFMSFIISFLFILVVSGIIIGLTFLIVYFSGDMSNVGSGVLIAINIIFAIGVLTLIATQIGKAKDDSLTALLFNTIMYIPCLIIDTINAIKKEYKNTTSTAIIVLGFDVAILLAIKIIPKINNFLFNVPGEQLLLNPIYTDNVTILGTYEQYKNMTPVLLGKTNDDKFKYNYAISGWIYIDPQPPNTSESYTKYTSILNYGNKPNILYKADTNTILVKMKINNDDKILYKSSDFLLQKWNNIIINYDGGTLDVFINNNLVASHKSIVPYMSYDQITTGSTNGIHGGICNVKYYSRVLSIHEIKQIFNSVKNKNPPLILDNF